MKNRIFAICLLICSFFSISVTKVMASDFGDLPKNHKNYLAVTELVEKGVVAGYEDGTFRPENEITRTEFCALLARTLGFDKEDYEAKSVPFSDVKDDYWGISFISFCYEKGLINGMGDGTFLPAAKVTYEQAVKMAVCALEVQDSDKAAKGEKWYAPYIRIAEDYDLLKKVAISLGENAKRSDCAQIVYNTINTGLIVDKENDENKNDTVLGNTDVDDEEIEENPENTDKTDEDELTEEEKEELRQNEIWDEIYAEKDFSVVKTIVIDAGHNYSGMDTGARNEELDIHEEDVTWEIADKLADCLEDMGYNVIRTRETKKSSIGNTSVTDSLKARVRLAHEELADLFISIHCNIGGGRGTETYCFSKTGYGNRLAKLVQKNITDATELYDRGVKTAGFYVIKNTRMPSVLVETGFMDNEKDIEIITDEIEQRKIAQAIADAVHEYATVKVEQSEETEKTKRNKTSEETDNSDFESDAVMENIDDNI